MPSGFSRRISEAEAVQGNTVVSQPSWARLRRMLYFTPQSSSAMRNSVLAPGTPSPPAPPSPAVGEGETAGLGAACCAPTDSLPQFLGGGPGRGASAGQAAPGFHR